MYFYINGKKVRKASEIFQEMYPVKENYGDGDGGKFPKWVLIVLVIIITIVLAWLIWCIVNERNKISR